MPSQDPSSSLRTLDLDGRVVLPGDATWDAARAVWNGMIDRQPVAVLQAASNEDVARGIDAAKSHGLPLAVRGGGHSVAGNSTIEGGLVIDLRAMHDVGVNPGTRIVTVGGGATLGELDRGTVGSRTAVPAGVVSTTGVGGLTVGGGMGWLTRAFGLSIDNLLAISPRHRRRTAGARQPTGATASSSGASSGGGSNFGVVTRFEFAGRAPGSRCLRRRRLLPATQVEGRAAVLCRVVAVDPRRADNHRHVADPHGALGLPEASERQTHPDADVVLGRGRMTARGERAVQDLVDTDPRWSRCGDDTLAGPPDVCR